MKVQLNLGGKVRTVSLEPGDRAGCFLGDVDGQRVEFEAAILMPGMLSLLVSKYPLGAEFEGRSFRCILDASGGNEKSLTIGGPSFPYQVHDPRSLATRRNRTTSDEGTLLLKATMTGRVVRIVAEKGTEVAAHGGVIVIEAMKMQNELRSPRAGKVAELRVTAGEMVNAGQVLAVIE